MRSRIGIAASIAVRKLACSAPPEPAAPGRRAGAAHRVSEALDVNGNLVAAGPGGVWTSLLPVST